MELEIAENSIHPLTTRSPSFEDATEWIHLEYSLWDCEVVVVSIQIPQPYCAILTLRWRVSCHQVIYQSFNSACALQFAALTTNPTKANALFFSNHRHLQQFFSLGPPSGEQAKDQTNHGGHSYGTVPTTCKIIVDGGNPLLFRWKVPKLNAAVVASAHQLLLSTVKANWSRRVSVASQLAIRFWSLTQPALQLNLRSKFLISLSTEKKVMRMSHFEHFQVCQQATCSLSLSYLQQLPIRRKGYRPNFTFVSGQQQLVFGLCVQRVQINKMWIQKLSDEGGHGSRTTNLLTVCYQF